jgi:hypothetical protein
MANGRESSLSPRSLSAAVITNWTYLFNHGMLDMHFASIRHPSEQFECCCQDMFGGPLLDVDHLHNATKAVVLHKEVCVFWNLDCPALCTGEGSS